MNRAQIERAEAIAERLARRDRPAVPVGHNDEALAKLRAMSRLIKVAKEAEQWERPESLSRPRRGYQFSDQQIEIAMRSLQRQAG